LPNNLESKGNGDRQWFDEKQFGAGNSQRITEQREQGIGEAQRNAGRSKEDFTRAGHTLRTSYGLI